MSAVYNNISELITTTIRNRTGELAKTLQRSNKLLLNMFDLWVPQEPGAVLLSEFIKLRAQGKAKMEQGRVYLLKDEHLE